MEWHQQVQSLLPDAPLFTALQLSFDLHFLDSSLQPYTTPAGARLLQTCHSLVAQAVSHCLCGRDAQCRQVQQAFGDHTISPSVAAWLSVLGQQAVEQALSRSSFSSACLVDAAAAAQAAMSAPATSSLSRHASSSSRLSSNRSGIDMPASAQRRLVISKPKSAVQSRLIGKTASTAAALAALQGKYAMPSTPRSPAIKAFHQTPFQLSTTLSSFSPFSASDHHSTTSSFENVRIPTAQQLSSKPSRLRTLDSSSSSRIGSDSRTGSILGPNDRPGNMRNIGSDGRTGSILGPKDRASRHKPPVLQPHSSISLNAIAAIHKLPPLQVPLQA